MTMETFGALAAYFCLSRLATYEFIRRIKLTSSLISEIGEYFGAVDLIIGSCSSPSDRSSGIGLNLLEGAL